MPSDPIEPSCDRDVEAFVSVLERVGDPAHDTAIDMNGDVVG
jgi:hypothetical protein